MHWKTKAALQRWIAALPEQVSLAMYYQLQRHFGGLKNTNPMTDIGYGHELVQRAKSAGRDIRGARILEVGTGRRLNLPITWWLCGARSVTTVDLHPYLKLELVLEDIERLQQSATALRSALGEDLVEERLQRLLGAPLQESRLDRWLELFGIKYLSPADASSLPLDSASIDLHVSNNVLEHIPENVIVAILAEGGRLLTSDGIYVHRVDFSDHFARGGNGLSSANFLSFSPQDWNHLAGNRYMYMNRLRVDDMDALFTRGGVAINSREATIDTAAVALIREGTLSIDAAFAGKSVETLATKEAWYVGSTCALEALPGRVPSVERTFES
jgi:hypothetical protein